MIDRLRALLHRPLSERERRPLFLACAAMLLAAGAAALALGGGAQRPARAPQPATSDPVPSEPAAAEAQPAPDPSAPPADIREARRVTAERRAVSSAEQVARRFLRVYLPYSYGQRPQPEVEAVASPRLASALAQLRPRVPASVTGLAQLRPRVPASVTGLRPRVTRLQSEALGGGRLEAVAFIEDGERRYALPVRLARNDDGWRVVGLGG
jgi:hypothetical protein